VRSEAIAEAVVEHTEVRMLARVAKTRGGRGGRKMGE